MSQPAFADGKPIDDFKSKLEEWKVEAVCKRKYIQVSKLLEWMNEEVPIATLGVSTKNIDRLLASCQRRRGGFSQDSKGFAKGGSPCVLIFSILLELNAGHLVHDLRRQGWNDHQLPLDLAQLERNKTLRTSPGLAQQFNDAQWKYCPLRFGVTEEVDIPREHIVPICVKQRINEGGTAFIYQIFVQAEFLDVELKRTVAHSRYDDPNYGPCYSLVLKTYKDGNEREYDNEAEAFRGLKKNSGMIKCLFNYSHARDKDEDDLGAIGVTTYNLVLEYGEFDLNQYFHYYLPPVLEKEQLAFWSDLFLVAHAVQGIHDFEHGNEKYYGWHNDIKPENILNVRGEFKLADPGFARFEKQEEGKDATDWIGGTSTFGAPECYAREHQKPSSRGPLTLVHRSVDIWSLGCVFSLAATWMVFGRAGIDQFAHLRRAAFDQNVANQAASQRQDIPLVKGDYFHNGFEVLEEVETWHDHLRRCLRKNDPITEVVLSLVEKHMLLTDPQTRISAKDLCDKLKKIKGDIETIKQIPVPQCVEHALQRTEEDWAEQVIATATAEKSRDISLSRPSKALYHGHLVPQGQSTQRHSSRLLVHSMQTSHRSKAAEHPSQSVLAAPRTFLAIAESNPSGHLLSSSNRADHLTGSLDPSPEGPQYNEPGLEMQTFRRTASSSTTPTMSSLKTWFPPTSTSSLATFRSKTDRLRAKMLGRPQKGDRDLQSHFENRDIVFVLDNGASVKPHWSSMKGLLLLLVDKARYVDEDGMDLKFTTSSTKFVASNKPAAFNKEIEKPQHHPPTQTQTNMSTVLGKILQEYLNMFKIKGDKTRKKTIIILTDGKWAAMPDKFAVDRKIVEFSKQLKDLRPNSLEEDERRLSIQFVRFGDDHEAVRRLRRLDDRLKYQGVPDIVDHKPADAELFKILTGAVDEGQDESDKDGSESDDPITDSPEQLKAPIESESQTTPGSTPTKASSGGSKRYELFREPSTLELPEAERQPATQYSQFRNTVTLRRTHAANSTEHHNFESSATAAPSFQISEH